MGRPGIPPFIVGETACRTWVDADWKVAMGIDDEFCGIGATHLRPMPRPAGGGRQGLHGRGARS